MIRFPLRRSNQTHASTTDPEAKLYRKANGQSSRMAFMGHVLMENRNGLVAGALSAPIRPLRFISPSSR